VGKLMMDSHQATRYPEAETLCKQALHLYRKVEASHGTLRRATARVAAGKLADKAAPAGLYDTLINLGQLYGFMQKHDDALQVHQEALQEVRADIAHASTPQLPRILTPMGQMNISQYNSQITNGAKGDKGKCTGAKALLEEALSVQRALLQDERALLQDDCDDIESERMALCYHQMAFIGHEQADAIRKQVDMQSTHTHFPRIFTLFLPFCCPCHGISAWDQFLTLLLVL